MRSAAEYVAAAWESVGPHAAAQNVTLTAEKAVQAALDDAAKEAANREQYHNLLSRAIRNSQPQTANDTH